MLVDKIDCCGCSACVQICPKHSISFQEDKEGFLYPRVDVGTCIDCGLCEKVCPVINQYAEREPIIVYAAKNEDENIRFNSSSGGIFTLFAEKVIEDGGIVFGARFNEKWEVVHDYCDTKEGLELFRGSKYVQSSIGESYRQVEAFLKSDRKVMFTGTPCQVAGLKRFLKKDYENLLTIDVICHGVPSPLVWRNYMQEEIALKSEMKNKSVLPSSKVSPVIIGVNFRDKSTGWKKCSFVLNISKALVAGDQNSVLSSIFTDNVYMRAFLSNLSLRPSCNNCSAKAGKSGADITIGDFWGIENQLPEYDDDKGVSLVFINNVRWVEYFSNLMNSAVPVDFYESVKWNSAYLHPVAKPANREYFFHCIQNGSSIRKAVEACESKKLLLRSRRIIYRKFGI